ncbi:hypothetical protein F9C07_2128303, partial [Aspergillus flavus]
FFSFLFFFFFLQPTPWVLFLFKPPGFFSPLFYCSITGLSSFLLIFFTISWQLLIYGCW